MNICSVSFSMLLITFAIAVVSCQEVVAVQDDSPIAKPERKISLMRDTGGIVVTVDGKLFTRYDYSTFEKPILFPVHGPRQIEMTRNFPMKKVLGEADDHPHHKSIWVGHEINGIDFWANKTGVIKNKSVDSVDFDRHSFSVTNEWVKRKDNTVVCTEKSTYRFGASEGSRWIDASVTFVATHGDVTFDDTKEGVFAIRTHPALRINGDEKKGVVAKGRAINSTGEKGAAIWGKPAAWVDYSGKIGDRVVGVAIMDHPSNLRHPTTWHARDYGLVAANPFGQHHFLKKPAGAGAHTLKKGEQLTLRYRMVFHVGDSQNAKIPEQFKSFATE